MAFLKDCWPSELLNETIRQIKEEELSFNVEVIKQLIKSFLDLDKLMTEKYFKYDKSIDYCSQMDIKCLEKIHGRCKGK